MKGPSKLLIVVDPASGVPVYRQLMDQIRFNIATGKLAPGDELPSTRALSLQLGVNPMTISKSYSFLEKEGVVEHRPGKPLVVGNVEEIELKKRRINQLKESLLSSVEAVKKLGVDRKEAVSLFESLLAEEESRHEAEGDRR